MQSGSLICNSDLYIVYTGVSLPLVRALMDNLNLMPSYVAGRENLFVSCVEAWTWARIYFRAYKSRIIVIVWEKAINTTSFYVTDPSNPLYFTKYIPSIHSVLVNSEVNIDELQ